jgi:hypothetical protein
MIKFVQVLLFLVAIYFKNDSVLIAQEKQMQDGEVNLLQEESLSDSTDSEEFVGLKQRWAIGLNFAWQTRRDYGARDYRRFSPEILGYLYGETPFNELFWRLGSRIGYSSDQPEMPQAVRLEETDTTWLFEAGIVKDWYLVPSFSIGYGYDFRTTKVKTTSPVDMSDDRLNRKQRLGISYFQTGLGIPTLDGLFLIEPILRYHSIDLDMRSHWTFGVEWTAGF